MITIFLLLAGLTPSAASGFADTVFPYQRGVCIIGMHVQGESPMKDGNPHLDAHTKPASKN
jgi:hypothetical protein